MKRRDCRQYNRRELIEIIYELERREERLNKKLDRVRARLKDQTVRLENVGSLAEAAAVITCLFETAEETARVYLDGVRERCEAESSERKGA